MYPVGGGAINNNDILERENIRLRQLVESLQSELVRVKSLVLSPANQGDVIVRQEMEIKRLREENKHLREQLDEKNHEMEGVEVLARLRNTPSPSEPTYDDPELQKVHEEWTMDDARPYVNPEDRKKIRQGVIAAGPAQAQSPKKPEKKERKKRKPAATLNLDEPKRQEIVLDTKYKVGDNVEVVLYKWSTDLKEDTLRTFDATVVRLPKQKDGNFRGIVVLAGYYVVEFQDRRRTIAPALAKPPSGLNKGDTVYVIKGKFQTGYGSVKLEKKLNEKMEHGLRF